MPNERTKGAAVRPDVALRRVPRFNARVPALTRRRSEHHRQECWHIYYGDVYVGTIAERSGRLALVDGIKLRSRFV